MICVYFIGGSHFTRNIQPSPKWVTQFKNRGYVIKCARVADLDMIINECSVFVDTCKHTYTYPTIGVIGVSSGGYFALRLKKMIPRIDFCVGIAPILNPVLRSKMVDSDKIIRATPNVRKIYNTIDRDTLIIVGRDDVQAPIGMYDEYDIRNMVVIGDADHSITDGSYNIIYKKINSFLK
jgi:esterase/lipase